MEWTQYESKSTPVVMHSMINRYKNLSTFKKGAWYYMSEDQDVY